MSRGYMIVAQNNATTDYHACARVLAHSIKRHMPHASVSLLTDTSVVDNVYDSVIQFPHGDGAQHDDWKLANDWQVYSASPYTETIKIEADMFLTRSIDHWWDALKYRDLNICTTIRNYKNEISTVRDYRVTIDRNRLPDTYNALTYFKRSTLAEEFYAIVGDIFTHWQEWSKDLMLMKNERATTDVVYALAAHTIGAHHCTLPTFTAMSMIHMKQAVNLNRNPNWTQEFVTEIHPHTLRINTYPQLYPLHYHVKTFASTLESEL